MALSIVLLLLVVVITAHYVYERIVAPTVCMDIKYELFELRDEVYNLKISNPDKFSDDLFGQMVDAINGTMAVVDEVTLFDVYMAARTVDQDKELTALVRERIEAVEDSPLSAVRRIDRDNGQHLFRAAIANSMVGLLWLAVVVIPYTAITSIYSRFEIRLSKIAHLGERSAPRAMHRRFAR